MKKATAVFALLALGVLWYFYPTEVLYVLLGLLTVIVVVIAMILGTCVLAMSDNRPPSPPPNF